MTKGMQWDKAGKRAKLNDGELRGKRIITVKTDAAFWKAWKDSPEAMRASGYRVRKVGGRWHAWIEI